MTNRIRKAAVAAAAAGLMVMGVLGIFAVPAFASGGADPIWYLNCANNPVTLDQTNPSTIAQCASGNVSASGLSGDTFAVGAGSNVQITVYQPSSSSIAVKGTYTLTDVTAGNTVIASGTFSGATGGSGHSGCTGNSVLGSGTSNVNFHVASTDTLNLALTFTSAPAQICSGQSLSSNATTSIAVPIGAPEFALGAILPAALGLLFLRGRLRTRSGM